MMVEYGHKQYLVNIKKKLQNEVKYMLFSATITEKTICKFEYILGDENIDFIDCTEENSMKNKNIDEFKVLLDNNDKLLLTVSLFKLNILPMKVLIFVNSVEKCYFLKLALECFGITTKMVIDEQSIETRESILIQFNNSEIDCLVTFD